MTLRSIFVAILLCLTPVVLTAGELLLGAAGTSNHQILLPADSGEEAIDASLRDAATLIQDAFAAQGIEVPILAESEALSGKSGIYLGRTDFALANGIDFSAMQGWTYTWKVVGNNLIIAGNDQPDPMPLEKRRDREARGGGIPLLATWKGTAEFVYTYMGTRFLSPNEIEHLETPIIFTPDDLDVTRRPYGQDLQTYRKTTVFEIANGLEPMPLALTNYGHYHQRAIPLEEYAESHPEYFIYRAGARDTSREHYCFSNPEVREVIYQKVLADADIGYTTIELGQNDGFLPCTCQPCYELYDVHPTYGPEDGSAYIRDPAWGEKLWIMHRDMALRLQKDRPDVTLLLSAYSVARNPPTTFTSFPANVKIQIMRPTPEILDAWRHIEVPGGYTGYLYLWGSFHLSGYTPLRSAHYINQIVQTLVDNDVRIIQNNGRPFIYGIEGINAYAFRRLMIDPHGQSIEKLNREYIEAAYLEAAGPMHSFYRKLHQRLNFVEQAFAYARELNRNPLLYYSTIYTPDILHALDEHLTAAEALATSDGATRRLAATRLEFDYLKHIVQVVTLYHAFLLQRDDASHQLALDAVEARNRWLKSLMDPETNRMPPGSPSFVYSSYGTLHQNGRYLNIEPFNWDVEQRRKPGFLQASQESKSLTVSKASQPVTMDSDTWKDVASYSLSGSPRNKTPLSQPTSFQVLYDNQNLYFLVNASMEAEDMTDFVARGRDAEIWLQDCINIQLSPTGDKSQYYYLNYEPVPDSFTDAEHGFITDILHPKFGWNDNAWDGNWSYATKLDKANGVWISFVTIPFKTLRTEPPTQGTEWAVNVGRVHFYSNKESRELSYWASGVNISKTPGDGQFGTMVFQ